MSKNLCVNMKTRNGFYGFDKIPPSLYTKRNPLKRRFTQKQHIFKLPNEILENIFVNLNKMDRKNFEFTCHHAKEVASGYYKHEVEKAKTELGIKNTNRTIILDIINLIGEFYSNFGFEPFFQKSFNNLLQNLKNNRNGSLTVTNMMRFLSNFFKFAESSQPLENHSRIIFVLTTINLLKRFCNVHISRKKINNQNMSIHITVNGIWFAVVYSASLCKSLEFPNDQQTFLKMLAVLLINDRKSKTYHKIWDCDEKVIAFGNSYKQNARRKKFKPVTSFEINIVADEKIINFFETFLNESKVSDMPNESFSIAMQISCTEARKWGCRKFSEMYFSSISVVPKEIK